LGGTARKAKILRTGAAGSAVHGFYKSYKYTAKKPAETSQQIDPKEFQSQVSRRMGDAQSLSKGNQVWEIIVQGRQQPW
jgi:hypothetical protein